MQSGIVKSVLATAALAFAAVTTPASAADLWGPREGSIKDAPVAPVFSWSGFYVGGHAGLTTGNTQGDPGFGGLLATDYNMDGAFYGGHIGYNHQMGNLVLGIEGTYDGANVQGNTACVLGFLDCAREVNWMATVVGRIGYARGRAMVYAKGGVAWADLDTTVSIFGVPFLTGGGTHTGWTAGFGFAYALDDNLFVDIEYNHTDFGSDTHTLAIGGFPLLDDRVDAEIDSIRLGVSFKFGGERRMAEPLK